MDLERLSKNEFNFIYSFLGYGACMYNMFDTFAPLVCYFAP